MRSSFTGPVAPNEAPIAVVRVPGASIRTKGGLEVAATLDVSVRHGSSRAPGSREGYACRNRPLVGEAVAPVGALGSAVARASLALNPPGLGVTRPTPCGVPVGTTRSTAGLSC